MLLYSVPPQFLIYLFVFVSYLVLPPLLFFYQLFYPEYLGLVVVLNLLFAVVLLLLTLLLFSLHHPPFLIESLGLDEKRMNQLSCLLVFYLFSLLVSLAVS